MREPGPFDTWVARLNLAVAAVLAVEAFRLGRGGRDLPLSSLALGGAALAVIALARRVRLEDGLPSLPGWGARLLVLVAPAVAVPVLYRDCLDAWFVADDFHFMTSYAEWHWPTVWSEFWPSHRTGGANQFLRPIAHNMTRFLVSQFGPAAPLLHGVNIAIHAVASVLLGWVGLRLTGSTPVGLLTGLGFALEPLAVTTVAWVDTHQDPLTALCGAGCLAAFVEWLGAADGSRRRRFGGLVAAASLAIGLLSKEPGLSAAAAAVAVGVVFFSRCRRPLGFVRMAAPMVVVVVLYLAVRVLAFGGVGGYRGAQSLAPRPEMLRQVVQELPGQLLGPTQPVIVDSHEALRAAGASLMALVLGVGVNAVGARGGGRAALLAATGAVWLAGSLVPIYSMLWMRPAAQRYMYIPAQAFVLIAAGLVGVGLTAVRDRYAKTAAALCAISLLTGFTFSSIVNREQWLESASIPRGIAADLRAIDSAARPVRAVRFSGFPAFLPDGVGLIYLNLVPTLALGHPVSSEWRTEKGELLTHRVPGEQSAGDGGDGGVVVYEYLPADARLWRRLRTPAGSRRE